MRGLRALTGNEWIACYEVSQWLFGRLRDADADGGDDLFRLPAVVDDLQVRAARGHVFAVVALAVDGERFGEAARAGGEKA